MWHVTLWRSAHDDDVDDDDYDGDGGDDDDVVVVDDDDAGGDDYACDVVDGDAAADDDTDADDDDAAVVAAASDDDDGDDSDDDERSHTTRPSPPENLSAVFASKWVGCVLVHVCGASVRVPLFNLTLLIQNGMGCLLRLFFDTRMTILTPTCSACPRCLLRVVFQIA